MANWKSRKKKKKEKKNRGIRTVSNDWTRILFFSPVFPGLGDFPTRVSSSEGITRTLPTDRGENARKITEETAVIRNNARDHRPIETRTCYQQVLCYRGGFLHTRLVQQRNGGRAHRASHRWRTRILRAFRHYYFCRPHDNAPYGI